MSGSNTSGAIIPLAAVRDSQPPAENSARIYNLTVLVKQLSTGGASARAANLAVADVQALSMRIALRQIVSSAKQLIADHISSEQQIPWVDPPAEPCEAESSFLVPLHL